MSMREMLQLDQLARRFRLAAGLSQEELAERSGLSARAISDIERGLRATPRLETIRMLADGLALREDQRAELFAAARPELRTLPADRPSLNTRRFSTPSIDLPTPANPLFGREQVFDELVDSLREDKSRLITLTGPAGVGKTRLALEVAHRVTADFPGGAIFVDLAPVANPDMVASAIAQTLSIREAGDRPLQLILRDALAARPPLLLLLDNFEQVVNAAPLISDLLAAAPLLQILITSREALRVHGELEFETQPLDLPTDRVSVELDALAENPAVALFVQSARTALPGFTLSSENAMTIVEICHRLDGLPLAIVLAATRIRHFPPAVLLQHLDRRLPLLVGGPRDLPARQQTIRDTIAWSYDLLAPGEQALFRRLGVFVGGAALESIEAVASEIVPLDTEVLNNLSSLVDKSLVREVEDRDGSPRFSMLELVREFAIELLHQQHEYEVARLAHAQHILDRLESTGSTWANHLRAFPGQAWIDAELDNIRSAIDWFDSHSDAANCVRFVNGFWAYCYVHGLFREAHSLGQRTLELAERQPLSDELRVTVLGAHSVTTTVLGDSDGGVAFGQLSVALARQLPSGSLVLPLALIALAIALRDQHRYREAMNYAEQALTEAQIAGDEYVEPHVLYHIGRLAYLQNDMDRAVSSLGESLAQIQELRPTETAHYAVNTLAAVHVKQGNLAEAAGLLRESRSLLQRGGYTGFWFDSAVLLAARCALPGPAVRMIGFYSDFYASIGVKEIPVDPWIVEVIKHLREELGEPQYEKEYKTGAAMTIDEAMAIALDVLDRAEAGSPL